MPKSPPIRRRPRPGWCATTRRWRCRYPSATRCCPNVSRHVGAGAVIRPPFFCDFGYNIRLGDGVFLNFNCVILDVVEVTIGDRTQIGPAVQIYAADHPRDAETRRERARIRPPGADRQRRLDRRRRHHPARRDHRRRRRDRRRQRGDAGCRGGPDRCRQSGPAAPPETVIPDGRSNTAGLCDFPARLLWKAHVCAAHHHALAARLPPELRLGARPGPSSFIPRVNRVSRAP